MKRTSLINRCIALALALVLIVSQANLGIVQHAHAANYDVNTTIAQIIAKNYALSDAEKALLNSGYLASETFGYNVPSNEDSLVSVDTENHKITAAKFEGWVPTKAIITYGGETMEIALTDGVGAYDAATVGNAFSVQVVYELTANVDTSVQEALLGAAAILKQGVKNLDDVAAQSGNLFILETAMPELVDLANTGVQTSFGTFALSEACKAAIEDLNQQTKENDGKLLLSTMITEYEASAKTGYLMTKGTQMQEEVASLTEKVTVISTALNTIYSNIEWLIEGGYVSADLANKIKALAGSCKNLADGLAGVKADPWTAANSTGLLAEVVDYTKLDTLVAALGETTKVEIKNSLDVAEAQVQVNMAMFNLTYKVVVNHVKNNEIVEAKAESMMVTLGEGATAAEMAAAVAGFDAQVLAASGVYVEGKFVATADEFPATLTEDTTIVVTYNPKNFTVTIAGVAEEYPYGYKLTLPVHEDPAKSYDYKDANGEYYPQGAVVTVEDNMTFTREEGKSYTAGNLFAIISDNYGTDKVAAILNSGAVKGNDAVSYREPSKAELEELVKLEENVLTVQSYASSYAGLNWAPYKYIVDGNEKLFNGASQVTLSGDFEKIEVYYRLTLTNYTESEVRAIFDLVEELVAEAEGQKSVMDRLASYKEQMSQLNKNMLNGLNGMIGGYAVSEGGAFSDELVASVKAIISDIINNSVASDGSLKVNGIIDGYTDPNNGGLTYYYQNSDYIKGEISYLSTKLAQLLGDPQGLTLLAALMNDMGYGEYVEKLTDLNAKMAEIDASLAPVNAKISTTDAAKLAALTAALSMEGSVKVAECGNPYIQMGPVNRIADKYVAIEVKVVVGEKSGTFTTEPILKGTALTKAQVDALKKQITDFVGKTVEPEFYNNDYNNGSELDALVGVALSKNADYTYTWTAKEYTVKIDGEADQIITVNNLTITLPAHPQGHLGLSYEYTIGSKTANSGIYTFTKDELRTLFVNGKLTITRVVRNANLEQLEKMVNTINHDMGFEALKLIGSDGLYTGIEANVAASDMMNLIMGLVMKSGYGYIGLNGEGFIYSNESAELELSLQTLINAVFSDETFTEQTIIALGKNGKGKLVSASMQLGASAKELAYSDLAFTLNLTSVPSQLTNNVGLLEKATSYIKFHGDNGELAFELNLPDQVYAAYAAALVATGNVAKNDINGMTQKVPVQFLYDYITAITGSEMDLITYTNTLQMLGFNRDLTDYVSNNTFTKILAAYNQRVNVEINDDKTNVGVTAPGKKSIDALMNLLGIKLDATQAQALGMLKEYKNGNEIEINTNAKLANVDKTYFALVMDLEASGITNKVEAPSSYNALASELSTLAGYSAVILTADVPGNLTVAGTTVLDLNGFRVNGTITATGKLIIIDSTMDTYNAGSVYNVMGNVTILAGNYDQDVTAFLQDGYYMDGTTVRNALYTIEEKDNTLSFILDYESEHIDGYIPEPKALAIDIATDILLNYFMTAKVTLGGYELINVHADDLVGLYASDDRLVELVKTVMDWFTIGEKGYENNAGLEGIVNMILEDLLDFEAITNALKNNTALFSYEMTTAPWDINVIHETDGNYATVQVCGNDELAKTVNVALVVKSGYNNKVAAMTEVLADIVVKNETFAMIDLPTPTYGNKTLTVSGAGKASLVMDMSKTNDYAIVLGVILAYGNSAKRADVANAVNNGDMDIMKQVVDNTSVAELFTALKKLSRNVNFKSMADTVGVTVDTKTAADLEAKFHLVFCAAGKVLEELDITGMNSKLGALYNEETGYYELSKKDIFRDKELSVRGYSVLVELEATELTLKVKLFSNCLWGDADHDGNVNAKDATLILQYSTEILPEDQFFCTVRTDVNGDGAINAKDATEVLKHTAGNITKFPVEE